MRQQVIGIDLDGVLANFNAAYRARLISVTGRDLIPFEVCRGWTSAETPPTWNYAPYYGYTPEEDADTWRSIRTDPTFWQNLRGLPGALEMLNGLAARLTGLYDPIPEVYFITTRPGIDVKGQSESWLMNAGIDIPTVLITRGEKGDLARGLGLTHFLDDKPENCLSVKTLSTTTETFLLACRYNEWAQDDAQYTGVRRIGRLDDFTEALNVERYADAFTV